MDSIRSRGMQRNGAAAAAAVAAAAVAAAAAAVAAAALSQRGLPPGYRFKPSDEIILTHFLRNKVSEKANASAGGFIRDIKFSQLFETPPNRFVPCNPDLRDWYFFVLSEKDLKGNAKEIIMVGNGEGFWKFRGDSYAVENEDGEILGLKRDAVYYRIISRSNPATKLPKRTHWAMDLYQLPTEPSNNARRRVEKWWVVKIRRGKSYQWKKLDDPRYYRFRTRIHRM